VGRNPFERLIMITTVLTTAGVSGRGALQLADDVGYRGREDSRREQLARDIRSLKKVGLEISNVAVEGNEARWVLQPQDSRIRLAFGEDQRAELARAALLTQGSTRERLLVEVGADTDAMDVSNVAVQYAEAPPELELLLHAVANRCLVSFRYSGRVRNVHPYRMQYGTSGWWMFGMEVEGGRTKTYTLSRMAQIGIADPGSAEIPLITPHPGTDPLTWLVDEPIEALLSCEPQHAEDVQLLLRAELTDAGIIPAPGQVTMRATVVNRSQFLARVMELGARVRLVAPDELREEFRSRLAELVSA
jgi:predicted DNA-binding transcriptional regulator YafY